MEIRTSEDYGLESGNVKLLKFPTLDSYKTFMSHPEQGSGFDHLKIFTNKQDTLENTIFDVQQVETSNALLLLTASDNTGVVHQSFDAFYECKPVTWAPDTLKELLHWKQISKEDCSGLFESEVLEEKKENKEEEGFNDSFKEFSFDELKNYVQLCDSEMIKIIFSISGFKCCGKIRVISPEVRSVIFQEVLFCLIESLTGDQMYIGEDSVKPISIKKLVEATKPGILDNEFLYTLFVQCIYSISHIPTNTVEILTQLVSSDIDRCAVDILSLFRRFVVMTVHSSKNQLKFVKLVSLVKERGLETGFFDPLRKSSNPIYQTLFDFFGSSNFGTAGEHLMQIMKGRLVVVQGLVHLISHEMLPSNPELRLTFLFSKIPTWPVNQLSIFFQDVDGVRKLFQQYCIQNKSTLKLKSVKHRKGYFGSMVTHSRLYFNRIPIKAILVSMLTKSPQKFFEFTGKELKSEFLKFAKIDDSDLFLSKQFELKFFSELFQVLEEYS